jgi:hypothetical protein
MHALVVNISDTILADNQRKTKKTTYLSALEQHNWTQGMDQYSPCIITIKIEFDCVVLEREFPSDFAEFDALTIFFQQTIHNGFRHLLIDIHALLKKG